MNHAILFDRSRQHAMGDCRQHNNENGSQMSILPRLRHALPGLALCLAVALVALAVERLEFWLFGGQWIEALILAIGFGIAVRTALPNMPSMRSGIDFSAKTLLEVAI